MKEIKVIISYHLYPTMDISETMSLSEFCDKYNKVDDKVQIKFVEVEK